MRTGLPNDWQLIVVEDLKTPACVDSYSVKQQHMDFPALSKLIYNNYARKNLGYAKAIRDGAGCIVETDDDNYPYDEFWTARQRDHEVNHVYTLDNWYNIYNLFGFDGWPRGFPLNRLYSESIHVLFNASDRMRTIPIQNHVVDGDPDVDAFQRLTRLKTDVHFQSDTAYTLNDFTYCPFNSQCTTFFPEVYPLLYMPYTCRGRLDDIIRGFVAQRVCWSNDMCVGWFPPIMYQERNEHDFMRDLWEEWPGILKFEFICRDLSTLKLTGSLFDQMRQCYKVFIHNELCCLDEIRGIDIWEETLCRFA